MAPTELPRQLASLVLLLTVGLPDPVHDQSTATTYSSRESQSEQGCLEQGSQGVCTRDTCSATSEGTPACACEDESVPKATSNQARHEAAEPSPPRPAIRQSYCNLQSLSGCMACPPSLSRSLRRLIHGFRAELELLVKRSAFVLPGRNGSANLAFDALRDGKAILFLVGILPIMEHGLRYLFCCANGMPDHLLAHVDRYYTTLDGVSISHQKCSLHQIK